MSPTTRKCTTAVLLASLTTSSLFTTGCGTWVEETWDEMGDGVKALLVGGGAFLIAWAAGMDPGEAAIVGAVVGGVTYVGIKVYKSRQASQQEVEVANDEYEEHVEDLTYGERTIIQEKKAKIAVIVGEDPAAGTVDIMLKDPDTGEFVDDTVYTLKKEELQDLQSLEDMQQELEKKPDVTPKQREALSTERVIKTTPSDPTTPTPTPTPADQPRATDPTTPTPAPVEADDIRVGKVGEENVIFRI